MILVDALAPSLRSAVWRHCESCHLFCDGNLDELHRFAVRLGLKRAWFQDKNDLPHYDLTRRKRNRALSLGAVEADRRTTALWIRSWRACRQTTVGSEGLRSQIVKSSGSIPRYAKGETCNTSLCLRSHA